MTNISLTGDGAAVVGRRIFRLAQWSAATFLLTFVAFSWLAFHGRIPVLMAAYGIVGFQLLAYVCAAGTAAYAAKSTTGRRQTAWALLSVSAAGAASGIFVLLLFPGQFPPAPFTFYLFLVVNGVGLTGLALLLPPQAHYERNVVALIDALILAGSMFCILWILVFGRVYETSQADFYTGLTTLLYPSLTVVVLAMVLFALTWSPQEVRAPVRYLLVGWTIAGLALPVYTYFALDGKPWAAYIGVGGALAALAFDALAALQVPRTLGVGEPKGSRLSKLPQYVVSAAVAVLVLVAGREFVQTRDPGPAVIAVGITVVALLFARVALTQREMARLNRQLVESVAYKTEMLQFISHEISNPLTPLLIQKSLMQKAKEQGGFVEPIDVKNLDVFSRSLARLDSLSRDVRSLAQIDAGRMPLELQEMDVVAETQKAVDSARPLADQRGLQLKFLAPTRPAIALLDPQRFGQVVDNLLSNAMKFTPNGGNVDVAVLEEADQWAVIVQDTGVGLSPEQVSKLFTAFGRAHGNHAPGLGLGLVICRGIVQAHGGHISVKSPGPKRGARFQVSLPAVRGQAPTLGVAQAGTPA